MHVHKARPFLKMQEVIIILFHILSVWNLFIDTVVCVLSSARFDRLMSVLCQTSTLRDVIAFLKSFYGKDLLAGAPSQLSDEELASYHIKLCKK